MCENCEKSKEAVLTTMEAIGHSLLEIHTSLALLGNAKLQVSAEVKEGLDSMVLGLEVMKKLTTQISRNLYPGLSPKELCEIVVAYLEEIQNVKAGVA